MAEDGESLLIDNPDDERLVRRNAAVDGHTGNPPVTDALLVRCSRMKPKSACSKPSIRKAGHSTKTTSSSFRPWRRRSASALKNASLLLAGRKLEILEALVKVSSEITSTLRLDRLLQIIVNSPQNVLPYELCASPSTTAGVCN